MVRPQKAIAQPVERSDPHRAWADRKHRADAVDHLARGLVGERDRQDLRRAGVAAVNQPGDPRRQHPRLAAAGARQYEHMPCRVGDRGQLLGIQTIEEALHPLILSGAGARVSHRRQAHRNAPILRGTQRGRAGAPARR